MGKLREITADAGRYRYAMKRQGGGDHARVEIAVWEYGGPVKVELTVPEEQLVKMLRGLYYRHELRLEDEPAFARAD